MLELVNENQKYRLKILHKLYELSGGDENKYVKTDIFVEYFNITDLTELKTAVNYLEGEHLLQAQKASFGIPTLLRITHAGIVEVEETISKPNQPTQHFMPANILYVNQMISSSVQQGTTNSTQTATITTQSNNTEKLQEFIQTATSLLTKVNSDIPLWQEVKSEVETLRAQTTSPNPKTSIVKECLESIGRLCSEATAGEIGTQLSAYIPALLSFFKSQF